MKAKKKIPTKERVPNWSRIRVKRSPQERKIYLGSLDVRNWLKRQLPVIKLHKAKQILDVRSFVANDFSFEWSEIYIKVIEKNKAKVKIITICGDSAPIWKKKIVKDKAQGSRLRQVSRSTKKNK